MKRSFVLAVAIAASVGAHAESLGVLQIGQGVQLVDRKAINDPLMAVSAEPGVKASLIIRSSGWLEFHNGASVDFDGVYFLRKPDFAGYVQVKINGTIVYIPTYFELAEEQEPIGPNGPVRK